MKDMKLYDIDSGELCELIDSKRIEIRNKNEDYKKLRNKVCEIKENYPNILALIEDNEIENLNKDECKKLQKLLSLYSRMMDYEDREIFFLGARENYFLGRKGDYLAVRPDDTKDAYIIKGSIFADTYEPIDN